MDWKALYDCFGAEAECAECGRFSAPKPAVPSAECPVCGEVTDCVYTPEVWQDSEADVLDLVLGREVQFCGLNADWCTRAWYLEAGEPNKKSGGLYVVDPEMGSNYFELVRRYYRRDHPEWCRHPEDSHVEILYDGDILGVAFMAKMILMGCELR